MNIIPIPLQVQVTLDTEVSKVSGHVGQFKTTLAKGGVSSEVVSGAIIVDPAGILYIAVLGSYASLILRAGPWPGLPHTTVDQGIPRVTPQMPQQAVARIQIAGIDQHQARIVE